MTVENLETFKTETTKKFDTSHFSMQDTIDFVKKSMKADFKVEMDLCEGRV